MDVEFYSNDPRQKSRPMLDDILTKGVDQLAVACAFCTGAGIELLLNHTSRLKNNDSFVVVAAQLPTDYAGLDKLHQKIPGNLFVHWGSLLPVEKKVGAAIMHSKVFYARAGRECWLWTGSHNLTGSATQGSNCEAAVILHGNADEKPFVDAIRHLWACRNEATLYDPAKLPPNGAERAEMIAIHAETDSAPVMQLPWRIHLCLDTSDFDKLLGPPADVRLFLYPTGTLNYGWQNASPIAAYSGSLTGQNLTASNPRASRAGTPAAWDAADFGITESDGVLRVGPDRPLETSVTTQVVLYIDAKSESDEALFSEEPRVELRPIPGATRLSDVDPDMRRFFSGNSLHGSNLVNVPYVGRRLVVRVAEEDARTRDLEKIRAGLGAHGDAEIEYSSPSQARTERRHPFIVRVKYRLRGR